MEIGDFAILWNSIYVFYKALSKNLSFGFTLVALDGAPIVFRLIVLFYMMKRKRTTGAFIFELTSKRI